MHEVSEIKEFKEINSQHQLDQDNCDLLFYIGSIQDSIHNFHHGVVAKYGFAKTIPEIKKIKIDDGDLRFFLYPHGGIEIPIDSDRGMDSKVLVFFQYKKKDAMFSQLEKEISNNINSKNLSPEIEVFAKKILRKSYLKTCELIAILRREFGQYWLIPPEPLWWSCILYFSKLNRKWYSIVTDLIPIDKKSGLEKKHSGQTVILHCIDENDTSKIQSSYLVSDYDHADEMIATAFVDLAQGRTRSAIIHAAIALEFSAYRELKEVLSEKISQLGDDQVIEAISRLPTVVYYEKIINIRSGIETPPNFQLDLIKSLCRTRNKIIHGKQINPPYSQRLKEELIEVYKIINFLAVRRSS